MRVIVIGAGIIGAATTLCLAMRGVRVTLIDSAPSAAQGVTGKAFGWVNLVHGPAISDPAWPLRIDAFRQHQVWRAAMPSLYEGARYGSLVWQATADDTEALVVARANPDSGLLLIGQSAIAAREPGLAAPPPVAAYSPDDIAIDPALLCTRMVMAAMERGGTCIYGQKVAGFEEHAGGAIVALDNGARLEAEHVIVSAGLGTRDLARKVGAELPLQASPVRLSRFRTARPLCRHIVNGNGIEVRQHDHHILWAASRHDMDLLLYGHRIAAAFGEKQPLPLIDSVVGERPVFIDGLPRVGPFAGLKRFSVAVGHPGVILAPLLGQMLASALVDGQAIESHIHP